MIVSIPLNKAGRKGGLHQAIGGARGELGSKDLQVKGGGQEAGGLAEESQLRDRGFDGG